MAGMTAWDIEDRGIVKGKAEFLLTQLSLKFGRLTVDATRKVQAASETQLNAWTATVLTATTLDEALATQPKP